MHDQYMMSSKQHKYQVPGFLITLIGMHDKYLLSLKTNINYHLSTHIRFFNPLIRKWEKIYNKQIKTAKSKVTENGVTSYSEILPFFSSDYKVLALSHIAHRYSKEMSAKSEVVSILTTKVLSWS